MFLVEKKSGGAQRANMKRKTEAETKPKIYSVSWADDTFCFMAEWLSIGIVSLQAVQYFGPTIDSITLLFTYALCFSIVGVCFWSFYISTFLAASHGGGEEGKSLIDFLLTSKLHCSRSLEFVGKTPLHKLLNSSCCLVSSAQLLLVLSPLLASTSIFAFYAMLSSVIFNVYRVFILNVPFLVEASC